MKNLKFFCIAAIVMAIVPCLVQASTMSGPFVTTTPIPYTATDWAPSSESLTFPKFDTSLGTLDAVTLTLTGSLQTTATVYNISSAVEPPGMASVGTAGATSDFTVSDGATNLSPGFGVTSSFPFGPLAAGGLDLSSSQSSGLMAQTSSSPGFTTSDPGVLADFSGSGTIQLPAVTATMKDYNASLTSGTGFVTLQGTEAALTGSVTYTYTPTVTPEPSTFALLAIGIIGLMGYGWRKRLA